MQSFVHKIWYQGHPAAWLLLPLSLLFWFISSLRRAAFRLGLKRSERLPVPVVVVGNITAGGSGKTPTVLYLIERLRREGWRPGVISRGYGAAFDGELDVVAGMSPAQVGDEPAMIAMRTGVPMVVGRNRIKAAHKLLQSHDVNVILCDDGLQHYALERDVEILVIDGERRFGNGWLLPAGPLREGKWRKSSVNFVLCNGANAEADEYAMTLEPAGLAPVAAIRGHAKGCNTNEQDNIAPRPGDTVNAMAGIGNPERFFSTLRAQGFVLGKAHEFTDHMAFSAADIAAVDDGRPLLMTEKDSVKCREFAKQHWWYLAVDANLPPTFSTRLLDALNRAATAKQGNTHGL
ncbi:tetraacyldisaccharide 4'-kinase [Shewanella sp. FJAT-52076]|uniref:tetraacyldisaccharide 4'-kinase n=1 Tax=Shewanella sp. FJAT-52076 TaxID=2864202 RepID=UPI001C659318|nr:tetraacyldisaccharide 4'-kinase [Shewanella sp. FJAT-52076]QYJ76680.1 tetraacyldisaccharide 4'-kinase [Shewanella sp. FJAT-52076]